MTIRITDQEIDDVITAAHSEFDTKWVDLGTTTTVEDFDPETGEKLGDKAKFTQNELSPAVTNLAYTIIDAAIKAILDQINIEFPSEPE